MNIIINGPQGDGKTIASAAIAQVVRRNENSGPNSVMNIIGAPDAWLIRHELKQTDPDVVIFDEAISYEEIRDVIKVVDTYRVSCARPELVLICITNLPI